MRLNILNRDNANMIDYCRMPDGKGKFIHKTVAYHSSLANGILNCTTLCIAYPKGKRPELPYPQNPSKC